MELQQLEVYTILMRHTIHSCLAINCIILLFFSVGSVELKTNELRKSGELKTANIVFQHFSQFLKQRKLLLFSVSIKNVWNFGLGGKSKIKKVYCVTVIISSALLMFLYYIKHLYRQAIKRIILFKTFRNY